MKNQNPILRIFKTNLTMEDILQTNITLMINQLKAKMKIVSFRPKQNLKTMI
jgi:hypothetical protein